MAIASLIIGILALLGTCVSLLPVVQVFNYCINLPLALLGLALASAHFIRHREPPADPQRGLAVTGLALNLLALVLALGRVLISLVFGAGIL